jgi:hypothetical protein
LVRMADCPSVALPNARSVTAPPGGRRATVSCHVMSGSDSGDYVTRRGRLFALPAAPTP